MDEAATEDDETVLPELLRPLLGSGEIRRARPVAAGWSNRVWRVLHDGGEVFVRLPGRDGAAGPEDRLREAGVWRLAAAAGIAPEPLFLDPLGGVLVTPAVAATDLGDRLAGAAPEPALLDALGALLARFHALDGSALPALDPLARIDADLLRARCGGLVPDPAAVAALGRAPALARTALAHHDLTPANVLAGARLWLVDLEHAGVGDADLDLVTLAVALDLDARSEARLFRAAGRPPPAAERRRRLGELFHLREDAWAAARLASGRGEAGLHRQLAASLAVLRD